MKKDSSKEDPEIKKLAEAVLKTGLANSYSVALEIAKDLYSRSSKEMKVDFQGNMNKVLKKAVESKSTEEVSKEEPMSEADEKKVDELLEEAMTGVQVQEEKEDEFVPEESRKVASKAKRAFREDELEKVGKSLADIEKEIDAERHQAIKLLVEDLEKNHGTMSDEEFKYELNKLKDLIRNESADIMDKL